MSGTGDTPPKVKKLALTEDDDDEIDETVTERLWGLTEMFPESLRNGCSALTSFTWSFTKLAFSYSRSAVWFVGTTAAIMYLPVALESEQAQLMEAKLQEERRMLLGPNAAVSGQGAGMMKGMMPGMPPPPPTS